MQMGIGVVNVLDLLLPAFVFVYLVQKEVGAAMGIVVFGQFQKSMVGKPQIVQRHIQGFFHLLKVAFDVLQ